MVAYIARRTNSDHKATEGRSMNQYLSHISGSRLAMFLLGTTLALGFTYSAHLLSSAIVRLKHENSIKVKGTAEKIVTSDSASWQTSFSVQAANLKDAYLELEANRDIVKKYLTDAQVPDTECTYWAISMHTQNKRDKDGNVTNEIEHYVLSQTIEVKSKDVQRIDNLSKNITELIKSGIEIRSFAPAYVFSGIEQIKLELLGAATKNAYERATTLAENSHGQVGGLNSASQGVFQITPVDSTAVTDSGEYDTSTIEKKVKAVVTLEFHIEK